MLVRPIHWLKTLNPAPRTRELTLPARLLGALLAGVVGGGCVPARSPVTSAFIHPSLSTATLARDGVTLYGYHRLDGTLTQRQPYDEHLHRALRRAVPSVRAVSPQ